LNPPPRDVERAMLKEILIYAVVAISSMLIMSLVVHMFVGGLVSPETETKLTIGLCALVAALIAYMAWDVVRRRRGERR
jgi:membrane protein implicated in regulation of membrane protease activity